MTEFRFTGIETVTIEIDATFEPSTLALPAGLAHDGGRLSLFAFHVDKLRMRGVPLLSWSYSEVLWRIAVQRDGEPCWWSIACDLEPRGPAWAARRYVRYAVRRNRVAVDETVVRSSGPAGELQIGVTNKVAPALDSDRRPLRVGDDASWLVPWGDDGGASMTFQVRIEQDSLSTPTLKTPVKWADRAVVRRGRPHRCGVAHK